MSNRWRKIMLAAVVCLFAGMVTFMAFTRDEVPGADEKVGQVVEEYAKKAGVAERDPYINTDKGDLLLFLFGFSGLAAGFYLGYNWNRIVSEKPAGRTPSAGQ